jgi:hypothetical protein
MYRARRAAPPLRDPLLRVASNVLLDVLVGLDGVSGRPRAPSAATAPDAIAAV